MPDLILASASPRRKELLEKLQIPFTIYSPHVDETINEERSPGDIVMTLALRKAEHIAVQFRDSFVIGSDTIVVNNDKVLGKPKDRQEAKLMLTELSG